MEAIFTDSKEGKTEGLKKEEKYKK